MKIHYRGKRLLGLILISLGVGIFLVIILPLWGWLAIASIGLICIGWFCFRR
ncbi:MAG: hypothetical protein QME45_10500 [Clostridiales bacterium]|nr:hypothetical protein [Clostridiales bacterium]